MVGLFGLTYRIFIIGMTVFNIININYNIFIFNIINNILISYGCIYVKHLSIFERSGAI